MRLAPALVLSLVLAPGLAGAQQIAPAAQRVAPESAAPPELPRATVPTAYPTGGRAVRVRANADLQSALDDARPGDVLLLPAGATYVGNFVLRNKGALPASAPAGGWIVIRTDVPDAALGAPGSRMTPRRAASARLARILSPTNVAALGTDPGAHHYRLTGVEIGAVPTVTTMNTLLRFGDGPDRQRTLASIPHHLVVDRSYVHGNARLDLRRCIALNSGTAAVIDSWVSDCHSNHSDSQAILGYNGPGPYKIQNNYLSAGHEVVLFGGADPAIQGLIPSDIEVRGNHLTRPVEWKKVWQVKNLFETKSVRRLLVEGNVLENNWADGQDGFAFVIKSENQEGTAPWTTSSDVTIRYNRVRNTGSAFNIAGYVGDPKRVVAASRFSVTHNLVEGMSTGPFVGEAKAFQLLNGLTDAVIAHNTILNQNAKGATVIFDGQPLRRLTMHSNLFHGGSYGVKGGGAATGRGSLDKYAPGGVFRRNAVVGGDCAMYTPDTVCPATMIAARFVGPHNGDFRAAVGPLKGRGHDGGDIGADMDKIDAATRGAVVAP